MYAYIKGTFVSTRGDEVVIENNGIGYRIYMPMLMQGKIGHIGDEVCVYTYHYVREDIFALYGFPTPEDQDMFVLLLSVSGIGPKTAIAVVELLDPSELAMAVLSGDVKKISTVKGLGKKSAERIVLELKDKLKGFDMSSMPKQDDLSGEIPSSGMGVLEDCVSALVVLGYPASDANKAARSAFEEGLSVEELIRKSLRLLAK
ncbi:MAG: Holliday junction branch migration protein RuvA [Clostridiales bacterium]|nr:Holliday junction branch migration protein RuvA [Clostridiales bacterium]